jgi:hypothetical protein
LGTKAVRFSEEDEKLIKKFIDENPYFDFSTLARIAILNFIKNPSLNLKPVQTESIQTSEIQ